MGRIRADTPDQSGEVDALEDHLIACIKKTTDGGTIIAALINMLIGMLTAAPPLAREHYLKQLLLALGSEFGVVVVVSGDDEVKH